MRVGNLPGAQVEILVEGKLRSYRKANEIVRLWACLQL
jgi:hypothetical protein